MHAKHSVVYVTKSDQMLQGVENKVKRQLNEWRDLGINAKRYTLFAYQNRATVDKPRWEILKYIYRHLFIGRSNIGFLLSSPPSFYYLRYELYPVWLPFVLASKAGYILEVNSADEEELKDHRFLLKIFNKINRVVLLSLAKAIIFPTHELARKNQESIRNKKYLVLPNSIPKLEPCIQDKISKLSVGSHATMSDFVFVSGTLFPWHGIDKYLQLSQLLPEFSFTLIGCSESEICNFLGFSDDSLKLNGFTNITIIPFADRELLSNCLLNARIGVGTLALYRKSMTEACPLKVRDYLAHGLSILIAYSDPDLYGELPFVHQIANQPDSILKSLETIRDFASTSLPAKSQVSDYAKRFMSLRSREQKRLEFSLNQFS